MRKEDIPNLINELLENNNLPNYKYDSTKFGSEISTYRFPGVQWDHGVTVRTAIEGLHISLIKEITDIFDKHCEEVMVYARSNHITIEGK